MAGGALMAESETTAARRTSVLLEEYKELGAEIRARIDLQHRNMNVLVVLVTAVTGYLVKYASDHGLGGTASSLAHSELVVLISLTTLVINVFLWRHLDHDVNVIDKAAYVNTVLRPALLQHAGPGPLLGFERFLHERRAARPRRWGPFLVFGKEDVPMFVLLIMYLLAGWYLRLHVPQHAGEARAVFDALLYVGSALTVISLAMAIAVGREYATVGGEELPVAPGESPEATGELPPAAGDPPPEPQPAEFDAPPSALS